jgi:hypothetical protein
MNGQARLRAGWNGRCFWHSSPTVHERGFHAKPQSREEEFDLLAAAVEHVQSELAGIRQEVDEIRDDVTWATRNNGPSLGSPCEWRPIQPLTSMPLDPLAADWSARLNRITAANVCLRHLVRRLN